MLTSMAKPEQFHETMDNGRDYQKIVLHGRQLKGKYPESTGKYIANICNVITQNVTFLLLFMYCS